MKRYKIIDWASNDVNTGGVQFESFEDGWDWILENVEDEEMHGDLFVVEIEETAP